MNATFYAISHESFGPACTTGRGKKVVMAYEIEIFPSQTARDAWVGEYPCWRHAVKASHITHVSHEYGSTVYMTPAQARKAGIYVSI